MLSVPNQIPWSPANVNLELRPYTAVGLKVASFPLDARATGMGTGI
jgi:hypothetical protein